MDMFVLILDGLFFEGPFKSSFCFEGGAETSLAAFFEDSAATVSLTEIILSTFFVSSAATAES